MYNHRVENYILFDGDAVGAPLEWHLLGDNCQAAREWSHRVARTMEALRDRVLADSGASLLLCAGDEMLICVDSRDSEKLAQALSDWFQSRTGNSMSYGIGRTPSEAVVELRRSKSARRMKS